MTSAIKVACILVGSLGGVIGVATGYALAPAIAWPISLWWLSKRTALPTRTLVTGALRILCVATVIAGASAIATLLCAGQPVGLQVAAALAAGVAAYAVAALTVPALRRDAQGIIEIAGMIRKPRSAG